MPSKKEQLKIKSQLHPRNLHRKGYDFEALIASCPELKDHVKLNPHGNKTINFSDPTSVKMLNKALLLHFYNVDYWDIPKGYLCPPIPGRADYLHYMADLLAESNKDKIPRGKIVKCLDIGVGANCVYPIIGHREYGWSFIGSDVDTKALESAEKIIIQNIALRSAVELRLQKNPNRIFKGILQKGERVDCCICNPPFHESVEEAEKVALRKLKNLAKAKNKKSHKSVLNFGGQQQELVYKGGALQFINNMISESILYSNTCLWFSALVAKAADLKKINPALEKAKVADVKTIPMGQGNKVSRVVAWTFLNDKQRKLWRGMRW